MGVWSRGRPTLRPMPTTAMADMVDMVLASMGVTAMAVLVTDTADMARGLLTLRPMPTTAMAATDWDTDSAMEVAAMARGLRTPSPTMVVPTLATAMAVTVLALATA